MRFHAQLMSLPLLLVVGVMGFTSLSAQTLNVVSGNGQLVQEQFLTAPMVVQAKDALGNPIAGLAVTFSLPQAAGTLETPSTSTDASGLASTQFLATGLQPGLGYAAATVTASASVSGTAVSASFIVTTVSRSQSPQIEATPFQYSTFTGAAGTTVQGVQVHVAASSGLQAGQPIPNVGVVIENLDGTIPAPAACNAPGATALTDSTGSAQCDLVLRGTPGAYQVQVHVGQVSVFVYNLQITPGNSCSYSIAPSGKQFGPGGGTGTVNVTTTRACSWLAASNAPWVTITSGISGTGNGTVNYSVASNTSAARTGTMLIAGQIFQLSQDAGVAPPGQLTITTTSLPAGVTGSPYSATLVASGGTTPYIFSLTGTLPAGLLLNSSTGAISGTPTSSGLYGFTIRVTDHAGTSLSQTLSINIGAQTSSSFKITNVSLPNGVAGQPYQQLLQTTGGCITPFSQSPTFTLYQGTLPGGLALSQGSDGQYSITGTPTGNGTFNFTLKATAPCGDIAFASLVITIGAAVPPPAALAASPTSLTFTAQQGSGGPDPQTITVSASGQAVPYTAAVTAGGAFLTIISGASGTTTGSIRIAANMAGLTPNTYSGGITITPSGSGALVVIPVTLTISAAPPPPPAPTLSVTPTALTFSSPGPAQQTISPTSSGPAIHYTTAVVSGAPWLSAAPAAGDTPASITVTVNPAGLAPGTYTGLLVITPASASSPQNVSVTLNVAAAPSPSILSVTNAASFVPSAVAPGEMVVIFGSSLGPPNLTPLTLDPSGLVSTVLASARVTFDDIAAPVIYASARQVSAIVPYEVAGRATVRVQVEYQGVRSTAVVLNVVDSNPGIFTVDTSGQGAILNQNFSVNSTQNGADPESVVSIYATGEGQTNPLGATGTITSTVLAKPVLPVSVQIDGQAADVLYAGNAPGLPAGVLQVNAKIPATVRRGVSVPVVLTVGSASSQSGVTLFVSPQ